MATTTATTEASSSAGEMKSAWSFNQVKENDPAFSDARWTQFTKSGGSNSPSKDGGAGDKAAPTSPANPSPQHLTVAASTSPALQPLPVATSPTSSGGTATMVAASTPTAMASGALPPTAAMIAPSQVQGGGGVSNEATILYPVGTGANGAPLFMAITPSQLAASGGNPQLLLGAGGNQLQQQQPQQQRTPVFTASQQIMGTPVAGGGPQLGTPMASTPTGTTTNPSQAGVQMVVPPGMSIPVPVPLSTVQVKTQVGTPKYTGTNIPQPAQPSPHHAQLPQQAGAPQLHSGMPPMYGPPGMAATPTMTPTSLLQMQQGGRHRPPMVLHGATPPGQSPLAPGGVGGPMMTVPQQQQVQTVDEQQVWAANEHLFRAGQAPPALANPNSQSGNTTATRSQDVTPQAGSVRGKFGGERSNGPTPKGLSSRGPTPSVDDVKRNGTGTSGKGKMSRQEMLMQALEARDPSTTLPAPKPVETDDLLTEEEKLKRRVDLEEKLLGRKEDEPACLAPSASFNASSPLAGGGPASASSTPVAAWKAKPCKSYIQTGQCRYGDKCVFAHGISK